MTKKSKDILSTHESVGETVRPSVAVIGAGYWGKNLVRNFQQLGVLKTVCDADTKIRQQLKKDYPYIQVTSKEKEIYEDQAIDAVVIAAPAAAYTPDCCRI